MTWIKVSILAAVGLMVTAVPARADLFICPTFGVAAGGPLDGAKITFGGQLGVIGAGPLGFEGDFGYTTKTKGGHGSDNFRTLGAAVLIAPAKFGSTKWRPYLAIGGGVIGAVVKPSQLFVSGDGVESGGMISAGAGILGFLSDHIGVRLDARYFRAMLDGGAEVDFDADASAPQFIRASAGLVVRF